MSRRAILLTVTGLVIAGVTWEAGQAVWSLLLAMHGHR